MRLVEKYRPRSFDEIVGQDEIVSAVRTIISRSKNVGDMPNMLFLGPAGTGKTSMAMCIARHFFGKRWRSHFIELNASDERGIDVVRNKIKKFAQTVTPKIIFLDECDSMTSDAQHALRRIIETAVNTAFILSGNEEWKIIDPIKSRCSIFRFRRLSEKDVLKKILFILKAEGIKINPSPEVKQGLLTLAKIANGDMRKAINMLEQLITAGKDITTSNVLLLEKPSVAKDALAKALEGDFASAKDIIEDVFIDARFNFENVIKALYEAINELKDEDIKARLIIKLAETEHRCRIGSNPLIQLVAFIAYAWVLPHLPRECPIRANQV